MEPVHDNLSRVGKPDIALDGSLYLHELAHRTANDLAVACAEVHLAGRHVSPSASRDRLSTTISRLQSLTAIQRLLLPPRCPEINLAASLLQLCHHQAHARFTELGACVRCHVVDARVPSAQGWSLLVIVSELLTNAARHAFDAPGGMVDVQLTHDDSELVCIVHDNGVGLKLPRQALGRGSAIVVDLAQRAGLKITLPDCTTGRAFELRLAVDQPRTGSTPIL